MECYGGVTVQRSEPVPQETAHEKGVAQERDRCARIAARAAALHYAEDSNLTKGEVCDEIEKAILSGETVTE